MPELFGSHCERYLEAVPAILSRSTLLLTRLDGAIRFWNAVRGAAVAGALSLAWPSQKAVIGPMTQNGPKGHI